MLMGRIDKFNHTCTMQLDVKLDTRQFDLCQQLIDISSWLLVVRDVFRMREKKQETDRTAGVEM